MDIPDAKLRRILADSGLLDPRRVELALMRQAETGRGSLQEHLVQLGFLQEDALAAEALARESIPFLQVGPYRAPPEALREMPRAKCLLYRAIPLFLSGDLLTVATDDPLNITVLDDIRKITGKTLLPVYARREDILRAIEGNYPVEPAPAEGSPPAAPEEHGSPAAPATTPPEPAHQYGDEVVDLVDRLLTDAYRQGASDIHVEHEEGRTLVRQRIDGDLRPAATLPAAFRRPLVARIKIMSNLDITEQRLPQDGRILFLKPGIDIDIRVSTMPSTWGEKVVLRLLERKKEAVALDRMGYLPDTLASYRRLLKRTWGMILHVGPTGCGKTTTLNAALCELNNPDINIQTIEDPVEYLIPGVTQVQVHPEIGLTFARALRGFLRQDPDVLMVGEIRDLETAQAATEAALTGHLLFSTLHTNDAAQTVTRLMEIGVEPFLLSATLLGVCAQRLARRLCPCKQKVPVSPSERQLLGPLEAPPFLYKARGCDRCGGLGYKGRVGVHELLVVNDAVREAISARRPALEIRKMAIAQGMRSLHQDVLQKAIAGITSLEEAVVVAGADEGS